jgi:lysophospholipase L1-like esterase
MRLIAFGDSWTAGHGVENDVQYKEIATPPLFVSKLREQNSWPRWVAEKFDIPFVNNGECGFGNHYILKKVEDCVENNFIEKTDIVIVVFSYPYRYEKYNEYNVVELYERFENVLKDYNHYYFNAFYPIFNDLTERINLPNYFINPYSSLSYILQVAELEKKENVWEYGSKMVWNDKKNFNEGDYHPNLNGYKIISDYIYEEIKKIEDAKTK